MRARGVADSRLWRVLVVVAFLVLLAALAGCRESDIEESLGRSSARNIESTFGVVKDPLLSDWTTNLGEQAVAVSTRANIPYEFKVLDTDMVNAFAAPYGHVYFTRGILDFVDREDELAFVMSHEVGHVVARHSMSGLKKQFWLSVLFSVWNTRKYRSLKDATGVLAVFGLLRFSRVQEYEADRFGMEYGLANGYDPTGGAEFFRRLESENGRTSGLEVYFMTHPPTDRRITAVETSKHLDPSNLDAMIVMGEGYARRGQYRRATTRFQQAVAADHRSVKGHLGLAQALEALGKSSEATQEYRQVLRLDDENRLAQRAIERLEGSAPDVMVAAADPQEVQEALAESDAALDAAQSAGRAVRNGTADSVENLTASRDLSHEATTDLLGLADIADEAEGLTADLVNQADLALRAANESLYGLEGLDANANDSAARLADSAARAREALARERELDPWRVGSLREAARAAQRGAESLQRLPELRPEALKAVRNSQRVAGNVVTKVDSTFKRGAGPEVLDSVRGMTDQARAAGERAKEKVDRLKGETSRARTDALVSQIDVLGGTAPARMLGACDQIVAYYFGAEADEVRKMREDGRTYGQVALALAAERSLGRRAPDIASAPDALQLADAVERGGVDLANVNVFLKFLANTLEEETAPEA